MQRSNIQQRTCRVSFLLFFRLFSVSMSRFMTRSSRLYLQINSQTSGSRSSWPTNKGVSTEIAQAQSAHARRPSLEIDSPVLPGSGRASLLAASCRPAQGSHHGNFSSTQKRHFRLKPAHAFDAIIVRMRETFESLVALSISL